MDLLWGLLVGFLCGLAASGGRRSKTVGPPAGLDLETACERVQTRMRAGELVVGRAREALTVLNAQMKVGAFQQSSLAALMKSVEDLQYFAADLVGDQAQLMRELKEAFYGGSKAND